MKTNIQSGNRLGSLIKLGLFTLAMLALGSTVNVSKVFADCGVTTGRYTSYAGLSANIKSIAPDGSVDVPFSNSVSSYSTTRLNVQTRSPSYSGNRNLVRPSADFSLDSIRKGLTQYVPQLKSASSYGCGDSPVGVVLGDQAADKDVNGEVWALDCDHSLRAAPPDGQGLNPGDPFQHFGIWMDGNPGGKAGHWRGRLFSTTDKNGVTTSPTGNAFQNITAASPLDIAPPNGQTSVVELQFMEDPVVPPNPSGGISCRITGANFTLTYEFNNSPSGASIYNEGTGSRIFSTSATSGSSTTLNGGSSATTRLFRLYDSTGRSTILAQVTCNNAPTTLKAIIVGVKIDSSGSGGYGGECANYATSSGCTGALSTYPFSDNLIQLNGGSNSNQNGFRYDVDSGTYNITVVSDGASDDNWKLIGYSFCNTSSGIACSSASFPIRYFASPVEPGTPTTIAKIVAAGSVYQMRWIYAYFPPPPVDTAPTGTLYAGCSGANGSFSDIDGPTFADVYNASNGYLGRIFSPSDVLNIAGYPDGSAFRMVVHDTAPGGGSATAGDQTFYANKPNCSPILSSTTTGMVVNCADGLYGYAYDRSNPGAQIAVQIYVNGPRPSASGSTVTANGGYGIAGHGFYRPISPAEQNGNDITFYVYAIDTDGNPDTGPYTITMTGCGRFSLSGSATGTLGPTSEAPTTYNVNSNVNVTYTGWATSAPAVPGSDNTYATKNGAVIGSFPNNTNYNNRAYTYSVAVSSPVAGDRYCAYITVAPQSGIISRTGAVLYQTGSVSTSPACDTVNNKPFFKVFNSSVSTGGDVAKCTTDAGTLAGWFNNTTSGFGYGSSAQLGAYALAHIAGFASNQVTSNRSPTFLSFANNPAPSLISGPDASSPYLGGLLAGNRCISTPSVAPTGTAVSTSGSGQINLTPLFNPPRGDKAAQYNQNIALVNPGGKVVKGDNIAIYNVGDVYITDNIIFDTIGWTIDTIPSFVVSTKGNIYIGADVTQLDGVYEAQANAVGAGGNIYTCATNTAGVFAAVPKGNLFSGCNKQLTVNGSFVARKLNLLRTYGTLRNDVSGTTACDNTGIAPTSTRVTCASEIFNFSPEQYLSKPAARKPGNGAPQYDAITSLPPVL